MIYDDFRCMSRGKQLLTLKEEDFSLLHPINQQGTKKDRALLLFHGFTSSPAVYRYLIPQLKNYDAVVCPALPGHADSIAAFAKAKRNDWVSHANQECDTLFKEYQKVDVLGVSLGALLACKLSRNYSFNHMFLLAPALKLQMNINRNIKLIMLLKSLGFCELRGMAGNLVSDKHTEISYRRIPLSALLELFALIQEHQWVPPNCPTDLFLGTHDRVVASKEVENMFAHLPKANIHWLANSAHVLPLDNDLDQIVQCVNQCI
ncbi:alpha/beta hydrolase [Legionella longbeachae]|uniref:Putative lipase n=1 Tax=Legionella longbeachae serogroup 1 (strain NSW150) TaxID=661367 RepID=D3HNR8_LEGLN|nr:alpha/beta fold hydrolase [Legionella longbeachae]VEE01057.1 lipase [Legionella oakridgensis]HBD7398501.1 alpha/beta fold hydrolase [Legionella pneumophila]ARB92562.1 esterase [Legionella longbeachae]ARM34262.1 alpha/beta fold hydrolase [Legionella longbeachae]EEZ96474.1 esterase/lipase-like protein [Legionella longbeachae D-4968]